MPRTTSPYLLCLYTSALWLGLACTGADTTGEQTTAASASASSAAQHSALPSAATSGPGGNGSATNRPAPTTSSSAGSTGAPGSNSAPLPSGAAGNPNAGGAPASSASLSAAGNAGAEAGVGGSAGEGSAQAGMGNAGSGNAGSGNAGTGGAGEPGTLSACRGLVAVSADTGIHVSWRLFADDPASLAFNVYRGSTRVNDAPITTSTNVLDPAGAAGDSYTVVPVLEGNELPPSEAVAALDTNYLSIPLDAAGGNQAGRLVGVGDLDGDCRYDFVVKRSDGDRDVTQEDPLPSETIKLEAYNGQGQFMWRRDLGPNVRPGVWFSPFIVFDLDGDGKAEVALKSSEIPTELGGDGDLNGDGTTNYQETNGDVYFNQYPDIEFLEVWSGETGETLARAPWIPVGPWGSDGNRYNRNMMSPAYLDGQHASVVITRGGNSRNEVQAYDYAAGELTLRWAWLAANGGGNYGHNVRASDIDADGKDEFLFFNVAIDDDGSQVLWNTMEQHGDRVHLSDIDPDRPGLEVFYIQEFADSYTHPVSLRDARTGELLWGPTADWGDVGRGLCANIDARWRGMECWAVGDSPLYDAQGTDRGARPNTPNMAIWWDADLERELISGTTIAKWNGSSVQNQMGANGCAAGSRDCPMGYADVLGDWREEAWWLCEDNTELRIYLNPEPTETRLYTFMQDPEYRTGVGQMTQGYVQAPHTSFYVGSDMDAAPAPRLRIRPGG